MITITKVTIPELHSYDMFSLGGIFIWNDLFGKLQTTKIDQIREYGEVLMQIALPGGSVWDEFEGHHQEKSLDSQPWGSKIHVL